MSMKRVFGILILLIAILVCPTVSAANPFLIHGEIEHGIVAVAGVTVIATVNSTVVGSDTSGFDGTYSISLDQPVGTTITITATKGIETGSATCIVTSYVYTSLRVDIQINHPTEYFTLTVTVVDTSSQPLSGATVTVSYNTADDWYPGQTAGYVGSGTTSSSGTTSISVPDGSFSITVTKPNYLQSDVCTVRMHSESKASTASMYLNPANVDSRNTGCNSSIIMMISPLIILATIFILVRKFGF
jgi:hypothetical protein